MTIVLQTSDRDDSVYRPAVRRAVPTSAQPNYKERRELSGLMREAQDGDRIAYGSLLEEVIPILRRFLQRRAGFLSPADREDIVQDILMSLHAARATYDPERPFLPWLISIAHNRTVDNARRHSGRFANEVLVDELPETAANAADTPMDAYGDPEALRKAVKTLPRGQRVAIELLKLREMSLKEAAVVSGMSISALKVSVHRAIKSLRAKLDS